MKIARELEVDYAIIGTGAGGATAARVLSEAGRSLVLLEEGPMLDTHERPRAVRDAMRTSFRDGGTLDRSLGRGCGWLLCGGSCFLRCRGC